MPAGTRIRGNNGGSVSFDIFQAGGSNLNSIHSLEMYRVGA